MTVHLCRDYVTQSINNVNRTYVPPYLLAIFMRRVLGWVYVGDTNFNINSVGTLLIATGDSTPTAATPTFAAGTRAGLNNGTGTYHVTIPATVYTVTAGDVGRIVVLKSTANPTFNSGLFLITAIDTTSGRNDFIIDWRSGDTPPAEAADTLNWYLYEKDVSCPTIGTGNGGGGYQSTGAAGTPRLILQSTHATAYQVRICIESTPDIGSGVLPYWSVAPGFGGNAAGDFSIGGRHLHGQLWFNQPPASSTYQGLTVGGGDNAGATNAQFRVFIIGDDTGQSVSILAHRQSPGTVSPNPFMVTFGIPDNEPVPLPTDNVNRLYVMGAGYSQGSGSYVGLTWAIERPGSFTTDRLNGGTAFGLAGQPISCTPSTWTFVTAPSQGFGPFVDATQNAGDSPWTSSTDLLSVEVLAGGLYNWSNGFPLTPVILTEPRVLGTVPFLRQGRGNFATFTSTTDAGKAWMHHQFGVFMVYGGPALLP